MSGTSTSSIAFRHALITLVGGASLAMLAIGCGGNVTTASGDTVDSGTVATDGGTDASTGAPDSGTVTTTPSTDSGVATGGDATVTDAATTVPDLGVDLDGFMLNPDASLFEASIPDVTIGDVNAPTCYSCIETSCTMQLSACDKDPSCKGTLACVIDTCGFSFTNASCVIGCAAKNGVTSLSSPAAMELRAVQTCAGMPPCNTACGL
jgi:hypothetical protein